MGSPVMTLWVVQTANVAGEEARHVLDEIDFSHELVIFTKFCENWAKIVDFDK